MGLTSVSVSSAETTNITYVPDHGSGLTSDYHRCSITCIIVIIVVLALGFIVLCAIILRKCNEKARALHSRIQSFIVSEPGSIALDTSDSEPGDIEDSYGPVVIKVRSDSETEATDLRDREGSPSRNCV